GKNFTQSKFNRATQARRQMGSIFKPLLYAQAVERGIPLTAVAVDEPIELIIGDQTWRPGNFDEKFRGPMTLAYALSHSNNIVAIKTLLRIGAESVITKARAC